MCVCTRARASARLGARVEAPRAGMPAPLCVPGSEEDGSVLRPGLPAAGEARLGVGWPAETWGCESCLTGHPPRGPCVARPLHFRDPDSWILM